MFKHLTGKNTIKLCLEFGMSMIDILHLLFVGTGDKSDLHTMMTKIGKEALYPRKIFIDHIFLKLIKFTSNLLTYRNKISGKVFIINLCQGLPFYSGTKILFMQILLSLFIPKNSILWFCVHYNTVKIEQCSNCLCSIHKHLLPLNVKRCIYIGAKFRIING